MKKNILILSRLLIVMLGVVIFAFMMIFPHFEGRNVNNSIFEVYLHDPFLLLVYVGSVPFFLALHRTYDLLGAVYKNNPARNTLIKSLQFIKYCLLTIIGFAVVEQSLILFVFESDDKAGGIMMGVFIIVCSLSAIRIASLLQKRFKP